MIYVISKSTFGDYDVRDIQCNANWDCCPYSDYALIPDSLVDGVLATKGYCDITLNSAGTEVTSFTVRDIPLVPEECCGTNTVLSVNGVSANRDGEVTLDVAPGGFGLGETAWRDAAPDDQGGTGFYALSQGAENAPVDLCDLMHIGRTADIATQIAIDHQYGRPDLMIRKKGSGIWGDWRHINPKMLPNREYLTNEVWYDADSQQYKDVYVKALSFGNLASSGYTSLELGPGLHPISIQGFAYNSQYICDLASFRDVDEVFYQISNGRIIIRSVAAGAAEYKAIVVVKYWNELGAVIT